MCCCYVDQCCCGCTSHNTGVMIWAIIDALLNLAYFVMGLQSIGVGGKKVSLTKCNLFSSLLKNPFHFFFKLQGLICGPYW